MIHTSYLVQSRFFLLIPTDAFITFYICFNLCMDTRLRFAFAPTLQQTAQLSFGHYAHEQKLCLMSEIVLC